METENNQKLFSVFISHNSKIRELSDGNRVIVCQTNFLLWVSPFLSYELWKQRIELSKLAIQTGFKVFAKGPNPRVTHLVFLPKLGSEDRHATSRR